MRRLFHLLLLGKAPARALRAGLIGRFSSSGMLIEETALLGTAETLPARTKPGDVQVAPRDRAADAINAAVPVLGDNGERVNDVWLTCGGAVVLPVVLACHHAKPPLRIRDAKCVVQRPYADSDLQMRST